MGAQLTGDVLTLTAIAILALAAHSARGSAARRKPRKKRRKPVGRHPLAWAPPTYQVIDQQGELVLRKKTRKRGGGLPVNPTLTLLPPPGQWVGPQRCVCGQSYAAFRSGTTFQEGASLIRHAAGQQQGGGWRSPGAVLWAMKVLKTERWYRAHAGCIPPQQQARRTAQQQRQAAQQRAVSQQRIARQYAAHQRQRARWRAAHPHFADPQLSAGTFEQEPSPQTPELPAGHPQQDIPF